MKGSLEQLAQRLSAAIGAESITAEPLRLTEHAVDGVTPHLICTPNTTEQLASAVKICSEAQATIAPWGGGTAISLGNPPRSVDVVMRTARLNRVIEHDHANLTATVQSGISLNRLQAAVAPQKQFIPFDPPLPERSTIGGIVAANLNGPRRGSYGSVRDLIIGMKVILATGETIKAGGKVVKNVAGYDMCKLFTGSLGTLGIIAEVTMRVAPIPAHSATVVGSGTLAQSLDCASQLSRTKLLPTAVSLLNHGGTQTWQLAVSFDGFAETLARQDKEFIEMAQRSGLTQEIMAGDRQKPRWQQIADLPVKPQRVIYRLIVPRGALTQTISTLVDWSKTEPPAALCADVAMGTIWLVMPGNRPAIELFPRLVTLAQQQRGHAVIFNASAELKQGIDVWGPATPAHGLMGKIKQEFDPAGLLNPGRFLGGL